MFLIYFEISFILLVKCEWLMDCELNLIKEKKPEGECINVYQLKSMKR